MSLKQSLKIAVDIRIPKDLWYKTWSAGSFKQRSRKGKEEAKKFSIRDRLEQFNVLGNKSKGTRKN